MIYILVGDMDSAGLPLIGAHGYCTQEMVNLLMFGSAVSNTFDGHMILDAQGGMQMIKSNHDDVITEEADSAVTVLKGVVRRSDIGLLSLFEHYKGRDAKKNRCSELSRRNMSPIV